MRTITRATFTAGKDFYLLSALLPFSTFPSLTTIRSIRNRLMHGSSYIWGFLVPASILLFVGFYLSAQLSGAVKLTAALQVDQRARNKIIKRRGLQIGLFFKVSREISSTLVIKFNFFIMVVVPSIRRKKLSSQCHKHFIFVSVTTSIMTSIFPFP